MNMNRKKIILLTLVVSISVLIFSGCLNSKQTKTTNNIMKDGKKYNPPIEITSVKGLWSPDDFNQGEDINNNIWTKSYDEDLGIKLKYLWSVPMQQYVQKINITIASNDLPDLFAVNQMQFNQLVNGDMIEDLTELYSKNRSDFVDKILNSDGGFALKMATKKNRLYAIPGLGSSNGETNMLYIRKDWLDKLGLQPPKTMEELRKIAEAFVNNDPDGNGKKDTVGIPLQKDLLTMTGACSFLGISEGFGGHFKDTWIRSKDGKLLYGAVQPEMKQVLDFTAKMFKDGLIDPEFVVKDYKKECELIISGKCGINYGNQSLPYYPNKDSRNFDGAEWRAYPIPTENGNQPKVSVSDGVSQYFVVKKNCKNPEAVIKLLNYTLSKVNPESPDYRMEYQFGITKDEKELLQKDKNALKKKSVGAYNYACIMLGRSDSNLNSYRKIVEFSKNGDLSVYKNSDMTEKDISDIKNAIAGNVSDDYYTSWRWGGLDNSSLGVLAYYNDNNLQLKSAFYGEPTSSMTLKKSSLDKLISEAYVKIITGYDQIDSFDKMVDTWYAQGGKEITNEVNEWDKNK